MRRLILVFLVVGAFSCASHPKLSARPAQDELRNFLTAYAAAWERIGTSEKIAAYERELKRAVEDPARAIAVRGAIDSLQSGWKAERRELMQRLNSLRAAGRGRTSGEETWLRTVPMRLQMIDRRGRRLQVLRGKLFPAFLAD